MTTYTSRQEGNHKFNAETSDSLYQVCKSIVGISGGIVVEMFHKRGRLVAFWCPHRGYIVPGWEANQTEREAIEDYKL